MTRNDERLLAIARAAFDAAGDEMEKQFAEEPLPDDEVPSVLGAALLLPAVSYLKHIGMDGKEVAELAASLYNEVEVSDGPPEDPTAN